MENQGSTYDSSEVPSPGCNPACSIDGVEISRIFGYHHNMKFFLRSLLPVALLLGGCVQTIAIRTVGGILDYGMESFYEEPDLQLAREALGSNLKLIEALVKGDPENEQLLLMASQGFSAYALAFVEDDSAERAARLYVRGRDYALRILTAEEEFAKGLSSDVSAFRRSLEAFGDDDVPAVFWAAFGWGSAINLSRTDPAAIADLPRVNAMMEFVVAHDRTYYYGGALVYLATMNAVTPVMLGGNPDRAKILFDEAAALTQEKFLMTLVYYAQSYAMQTLDQDLFNELLDKVDRTALDVLPEARLPNVVAKEKARRLRVQAQDYF